MLGRSCCYCFGAKLDVRTLTWFEMSVELSDIAEGAGNHFDGHTGIYTDPLCPACATAGTALCTARNGVYPINPNHLGGIPPFCRPGPLDYADWPGTLITSRLCEMSAEFFGGDVDPVDGLACTEWSTVYVAFYVGLDNGLYLLIGNMVGGTSRCWYDEDISAVCFSDGTPYGRWGATLLAADWRDYVPAAGDIDVSLANECGGGVSSTDCDGSDIGPTCTPATHATLSLIAPEDPGLCSPLIGTG